MSTTKTTESDNLDSSKSVSTKSVNPLDQQIKDRAKAGFNYNQIAAQLGAQASYVAKVLGVKY